MSWEGFFAGLVGSMLLCGIPAVAYLIGFRNGGKFALDEMRKKFNP